MGYNAISVQLRLQLPTWTELGKNNLISVNTIQINLVKPVDAVKLKAGVGLGWLGLVIWFYYGLLLSKSFQIRFWCCMMI